MNISLLCVGRMKEDYLRAAQAEYQKRLRPYCALEVVETRDSRQALERVPAAAHVYAWDERGALLTSQEFARDILGAEERDGGGALVVFAIGGPEGHPDAMRERAQRTIALGRLTIAHRLVRLLVLEQIYRGFRILRGQPYHRL